MQLPQPLARIVDRRVRRARIATRTRLLHSVVVHSEELAAGTENEQRGQCSAQHAEHGSERRDHERHGTTYSATTRPSPRKSTSYPMKTKLGVRFRRRTAERAKEPHDGRRHVASTLRRYRAI